MTNDSVHVDLTARDLVIGARGALPNHPTFTAALRAALRAARKAGADRVEIVDGRIVIALAKSNGNPPGSCVPDANPWDSVLPGGGDGAD
jgi:hypothetical protein